MRVLANQMYGLLEEPVAEVNNYKVIAQHIIDYLKSFLVTFYEY